MSQPGEAPAHWLKQLIEEERHGGIECESDDFGDKIQTSEDIEHGVVHVGHHPETDGRDGARLYRLRRCALNRTRDRAEKEDTAWLWDLSAST
jgi:hypothetical protein